MLLHGEHDIQGNNAIHLFTSQSCFVLQFSYTHNVYILYIYAGSSRTTKLKEEISYYENGNKSFINDEDIDNYFSSTPSFEVEVKQSLYVSSQRLAETRFHQVQPTKIVQLYLQGSRNTKLYSYQQLDPKTKTSRNSLLFFYKLARRSLEESFEIVTPKMITNLKDFSAEDHQVCDKSNSIQNVAAKFKGMMSNWLVNRVCPSLTFVLALFYYMG